MRNNEVFASHDGRGETRSRQRDMIQVATAILRDNGIDCALAPIEFAERPHP
jgi:hypothetical protein